MHSFFFTYISNSHSHSHFFIRGTCYFCYFCYRLTIFLLFYLFTFLPFYFFTFKRPFTFKLRPDAAVATSRRVWRCVGT